MGSSRCPTCGKPVAKSGPDRPKSYPFCSDRCKLVDLGKWFDEEYRIPAPIESPEQVEELLREEEERLDAESAGE
ncbi:MAG: DNA gyrase inhibitor YacG [Phycisphaerae bacterium]|nr:DNA gyrase inhibitor YacG [Phycisphaerae bacterium]